MVPILLIAGFALLLACGLAALLAPSARQWTAKSFDWPLASPHPNDAQSANLSVIAQTVW